MGTLSSERLTILHKITQLEIIGEIWIYLFIYSINIYWVTDYYVPGLWDSKANILSSI